MCINSQLSSPIYNSKIDSNKIDVFLLGALPLAYPLPDVSDDIDRFANARHN